MEDWKQKLFKSVRQYINRKDLVGHARYMEMGEWLTKRNLKNFGYIETAQHVVELMEMIDRWHDEDATNQPAAPPANPFIEEKVERFVRIGTVGGVTIKSFNYEFVKIELVSAKYTPLQLRDLAKQLTTLAEAHEELYPDTPVSGNEVYP